MQNATIVGSTEFGSGDEGQGSMTQAPDVRRRLMQTDNNMRQSVITVHPMRKCKHMYKYIRTRTERGRLPVLISCSSGPLGEYTCEAIGNYRQPECMSEINSRHFLRSLSTSCTRVRRGDAAAVFGNHRGGGG